MNDHKSQEIMRGYKLQGIWEDSVREFSNNWKTVEIEKRGSSSPKTTGNDHYEKDLTDSFYLKDYLKSTYSP